MMRYGDIFREGMRLGLKHLKWAHGVGMSNADVLRSMNEGAPADASDFYVIGRIAHWYLREAWIADERSEP